MTTSKKVLGTMHEVNRKYEITVTYIAVVATLTFIAILANIAINLLSEVG